MTWATVIGPGRDGRGFRRALVDSDFEWLVKAAYHEAGSGPENEFEWGAVLWVLTNRWASEYGRPGETLGQYAQRFCQPINPNQIGKVLYYDRTASDPTGMIAAQARWNRIRANLPRPVQCYWLGCEGVRASPELVDFVVRFMEGKVWDRRYLALTDFAAPNVSPGEEDVRVALPPSGNAFYRETYTRDWTEDTVRMVGGSSSRGFLYFLAGLGLVAGAAVGSAWLRKRNKR